MSLLRDAPKDEDQLSGDVVVSMTEKPAGVAGESVVATVGTAAAVAKCRQVLDIKMISKGQADGPLRPCDLISEGVERQDVNPAARGHAPLDRLSPTSMVFREQELNAFEASTIMKPQSSERWWASHSRRFE